MAAPKPRPACTAGGVVDSLTLYLISEIVQWCCLKRCWGRSPIRKCHFRWKCEQKLFFSIWWTNSAQLCCSCLCLTPAGAHYGRSLFDLFFHCCLNLKLSLRSRACRRDYLKPAAITQTNKPHPCRRTNNPNGGAALSNDFPFWRYFGPRQTRRHREAETQAGRCCNGAFCRIPFFPAVTRQSEKNSICASEAPVKEKTL